ncbi:MAG: hypothetical protein U0800_24925 [Isosphaeraceae bacterium]
MLGNQRRTRRPRPALRPGQSLEFLERRELLTGNNPFSYYHTSYQTVNIGPGYALANNYLAHPVNTATHAQLDMTDNEGKVVSGQDRQGNKWIIKVQGPGAVIVTDATPNDGALDDDIVTIQLIGTDINKTKVLGQAIASDRVLTDGTVKFQKLISLNGVHTIQLNGFSLSQVVTPTTAGAQQYSDTYISLPGGVRNLSFNDINGDFDVSAGATPVIDVTIGNPTTPLKYPTSIHIGSIFNTASAGTNANPLGSPKTRPTVNISVNGDIQDLSMISSTARSYNFTAGRQIQNTPVSVTAHPGPRLSAKTINVVGSARNTTFSAGCRLQSAVVRRPEGGRHRQVRRDRRRRADRGRRPDPSRHVQSRARQPQRRAAAGNRHERPDRRHLAGHARQRLRLLGVRPPGRRDLCRRDQQRRRGPGQHHPAHADRPQLHAVAAHQLDVLHQPAGDGPDRRRDHFGRLDPAREHPRQRDRQRDQGGLLLPDVPPGPGGHAGRSKIGNLKQTGDLIDSVISSTYRPADNIYGNGNDQAGNGSISGHQYGDSYVNGRATPLQNLGAGNYAKEKFGYLPPMAARPSAAGSCARSETKSPRRAAGITARAAPAFRLRGLPVRH